MKHMKQHCRGVPDPQSSSDSGEEPQCDKAKPPLYLADSHPNFPVDITSHSQVKPFTKNKSDSDEDQSVSQIQVRITYNYRSCI